MLVSFLDWKYIRLRCGMKKEHVLIGGQTLHVCLWEYTATDHRSILVVNKFYACTNLVKFMYQGIWCLFLSGREGIWSPLIGGGEFDCYPQFHVSSRADSTWVNKSWRRRWRQTLMNSKEQTAYSWRIGWKPKAYASCVPYLKVFKNDLYLYYIIIIHWTL